MFGLNVNCRQIVTISTRLGAKKNKDAFKSNTGLQMALANKKRRNNANVHISIQIFHHQNELTAEALCLILLMK